MEIAEFSARDVPSPDPKSWEPQMIAAMFSRRPRCSFVLSSFLPGLDFLWSTRSSGSSHNGNAGH